MGFPKGTQNGFWVHIKFTKKVLSSQGSHTVGHFSLPPYTTHRTVEIVCLEQQASVEIAFWQIQKWGHRTTVEANVSGNV